MAQREQPPKLGATFLPGGVDDYYMPSGPDLVSPAPQRKLAELPDQIQQSIAALELDSNAVTKQSNSPPAKPAPKFNRMVQPDFSIFPKVSERTMNVPPSDEEKENILANARIPVLGCSDPEVQLVWADDALTFVDITAELDRRTLQIFGTKSTESQASQQMRTDAAGIVDFLANQGHPKAEFMKGLWLEFGKFGYREDKAEAFRAYKRAAEKGYARAEYRMGMLFESTNQPIEALQHYRAGERAGDSAACYRLGMTHLLGQLGQPEDFPVAVALIRRSAENADANAPQGAYVYGMLLANELPQVTIPAPILPPDPVAARTHLERSAFLGFSKSQAKMGSAYELCSLGCPFDPALSLHYNKLAARQGEADAEMAISKWFLCGSTGIFNKSEATAYYFAERAAADGLDTAEFAMGYFNEVGISCPMNLELAQQWYQKAASKGNQDAASRIEEIAKKKTLSKKDHETIALQRIRSTHASKRGGRPDRLVNARQQALPPMPVSPSSVYTASPIQPTHPGPARDSWSAQPPPPRTSSITPYPLDERPASVAPYPIGNDARPSVKTSDPLAPYLDIVQRPVSTAVDGRGGPRPPRGPMQGGPGRPVDGRGHLAPGGRPAPAQPVPGQRAQGQRPPSGNAPALPPKEHFANDFGYSAPADVRKAARTPDFSTRPPATNSNCTPPRTQPPKQQQLPLTQLGPNPDPSGRRPSAGLPSMPPKQSAPAKLSKPDAPATSAAASRPPGKGPQTFEQMGIPLKKKEEECTIM